MTSRPWHEYLASGFDLTDAEKEALNRLSAGEPASVGDRPIRAEVVRLMCWDPGEHIPDRVELKEARVIGRLDLSHLHVRHSLLFTNCHFDAGVDFSWVHAEEPLEFFDCQIDDLRADRLHAKKDFTIGHCHVKGNFTGAEIGGDLSFRRSRLAHPDGVALNAPHMMVDGSLSFEGCHVNGEISLVSSYVGHDLDCRHGRFHNKSATAIDATCVVVGRELLCDEEFHATGEVRLEWAQAHVVRFRAGVLSNVGGVALHADGLRISAGLYLDRGFHATGVVRLIGANIGGELCCTEATFENRSGIAIDAERLVAADVYFDRGFSAVGQVRLVGALLHRQLNCTGAKFDNPGGYALDADGLICGGSVFFDEEFSANGQVRLVGATIKEELNCTSGLFQYPGGDALFADGLTSEGNVLLDNKFRAIGGVRLARATVGRQLNCTGGTFNHGGGIALNLTGLIGHGDVELKDNFRAIGEVRMRDATVDRDVNLIGGHLKGNGSTAFDAHGLRVGGSLLFRLAEPPEGRIDVSFAEVNRLDDTRTSWPTAKQAGVAMNGFTYRSIESEGESEVKYQERIDIFSNMTPYSLQPYRQLSKIYRDAGRDRDAREVAIAGLRELRKKGNLRPQSKLWNLFLGSTVGYGYKLHRPFVILVLLGFIVTDQAVGVAA